MRAFGTIAAVVVAATALSGCMTDGTGLGGLATGAATGTNAGTSGGFVTDMARSQAKSVVNSVVSQRMPGVNAAPVTDCVIDSASTSEILSVSKAAASGLTNDTVNTVIGIVQRPETTQCLAKNGQTLF